MNRGQTAQLLGLIDQKKFWEAFAFYLDNTESYTFSTDFIDRLCGFAIDYLCPDDLKQNSMAHVDALLAAAGPTPAFEMKKINNRRLFQDIVTHGDTETTYEVFILVGDKREQVASTWFNEAAETEWDEEPRDVEVFAELLDRGCMSTAAVEEIEGYCSRFYEAAQTLMKTQSLSAQVSPFHYKSMRTPEALAHINRHFEETYTPGSKFLPMTIDARDALMTRSESMLMDYFQQEILKNPQKIPSRFITQIVMEDMIGTNALVNLSDVPLSGVASLTRVFRDHATPNQAEVSLLPTNPEHMPKTNIVTVIAGPYGDSGAWGIYTMFPGPEAPVFPNQERQSPDAYAASQSFWNAHAFRATPQEIAKAIPVPALKK